MSSGKTGRGDFDHECTRNTLHRTHFDHTLSTSHSDMPPDVEPTNLSLDLFGTNFVPGERDDVLRGSTKKHEKQEGEVPLPFRFPRCSAS